MGFFSWKTCDTHESIPNRYSIRPTFPVKMIDDRGNEWIEPDYEGYGVFGGKDFYALVDEMNGGTGDRLRGIHIELDHSDRFDPTVKVPRLVTVKCQAAWSDLDPPEHCDEQGYFY